MRSTLEQLELHRKYLYLDNHHEDGAAFLINSYNHLFQEQFDWNEHDTNKHAILTTLQEYIDTGGLEAGEFVYAVHNLKEFINQKYTNLLNAYIVMKGASIFREGFFEWIALMYDVWLNQTNEPRILIDITKFK